MCICGAFQGSEEVKLCHLLSYFKNKVWKKPFCALLYSIVDITLAYVRVGLDSDYVAEVSNVANGPIIIFSYQIA